MTWQIAELKQMLDTGWMYVYIEALVRTLISRLKRSTVVVTGSFLKKQEEEDEKIERRMSRAACVCGFRFSFCLASWSALFFRRRFSHPPRRLKTESWPNLDVGLKRTCVYTSIYMYILSYGLSARGDTEQHYFYFKFLFLLLSASISARWEPKSMKFYFCCEKLHTGKMVDFFKKPSILPTRHSRTHTHTNALDEYPHHRGYI